MLNEIIFPPPILNAISNGVLIVSGSRSIRDAFPWGCYVLILAKQRGWAVALGDASGVDTAVFQAWLSHRLPPQLIVLGCEAVGKVRLVGLDWVTDADLVTYLIPGGTRRSCFVMRDKALADLGALAPAAGFAGLWDGQSKGTQHTARFCREAGIPGFIQQGTRIIERWGQGGTNNMQPTVMNIKDAPPDWKRDPAYLYIGRANAYYGLPSSKWANPFRMSRESERERVLAEYDQHIEMRPDLIAALPELTGKILVCYCHPKRCHGDVLAQKWEASKRKGF